MPSDPALPVPLLEHLSCIHPQAVEDPSPDGGQVVGVPVHVGQGVGQGVAPQAAAPIPASCCGTRISAGRLSQRSR